MNNNITSTRSLLTSTAATFCLTAATFAATISLSAPVSADTVEPQRIVKFEDLNLATIDGAATLYGRLQFAARTVCAPLAGRELSRAKHFNDCYNKALDTAIRNVNDLRLSSLHTSVAANDSVGARQGA